MVIATFGARTSPLVQAWPATGFDSVTRARWRAVPGRWRGSAPSRHPARNTGEGLTTDWRHQVSGRWVSPERAFASAGLGVAPAGGPPCLGSLRPILGSYLASVARRVVTSGLVRRDVCSSALCGSLDSPWVTSDVRTGLRLPRPPSPQLFLSCWAAGLGVLWAGAAQPDGPILGSRRIGGACGGPRRSAPSGARQGSASSSLHVGRGKPEDRGSGPQNPRGVRLGPGRRRPERWGAGGQASWQQASASFQLPAGQPSQHRSRFPGPLRSAPNGVGRP